MHATDPQHLALVVDDEPDIRELLELTLERMGVACRSAADLAAAKALLEQERFDLCLTDMRLPDGNGIDLVRWIQAEQPHLPVAVITAHGNMSSAIDALKAGAFDFVNKPVELRTLRDLVETALRLSRRPATPAPETDVSEQRLLGKSEPIRRIRSMIAKLARSQAPVYISGESGTGKELVARLIHDLGPRAGKPFVPVNCGAIPAELMESELFGHKKGSFTGAASDKEGLFQAAAGGTLFLDEVADLPLAMQVKLLRALQEKAIRPVGAAAEVHVDVRILSATHKDLAALVGEGRFREDLFYRLNVIELHVPALRERGDDLKLLVEHFLNRVEATHGFTPPRPNAEAIATLAAYPFPGNVRELENIIERAITLSDGDAIRAEDLGLFPAAPPSTTAQTEPDTPELDQDGEIELEPYLNDIEKELILKALQKTDYNKTAAARRLGITFRALRYRLKKLGLE